MMSTERSGHRMKLATSARLDVPMVSLRPSSPRESNRLPQRRVDCIQRRRTGPAWTFDANGNPVPFSRGTVSQNGQLMIGSTSNYGHNLNNINYLRLAQERFDTMGRVSYDLTDNLNAFR